MDIKVEKQPKSTIKLTITVPSDKVKEIYTKVLDTAVVEAEIQGFRKGKAPRNIVEEKLGPSELYGEVINQLLQKYYTQAIKEKHISPISNPKVEIKEFDLEKDFEFSALVATRPEIEIKEYKGDLKKSFEKKLKEAEKEVEQTNKEKLANGEPLEEAHVHMGTHEILDVLDKKTKVDIPELIVEEEVDRMMSRIVDQTQNLGMNIEQYLKAQGKTADELRKEYTEIAEKNIKAEFILGHLVTEEKIEVTEEEIDQTFQASGLPEVEAKSKEPMERLYIKSILQKNKLLMKLIAEAEGEHHHEH